MTQRIIGSTPADCFSFEVPALDDLRAVMDAAGSERAPLLGFPRAPRWPSCSPPPIRTGFPRSLYGVHGISGLEITDEVGALAVPAGLQSSPTSCSVACLKRLLAFEVAYADTIRLGFSAIASGLGGDALHSLAAASTRCHSRSCIFVGLVMGAVQAAALRARAPKAVV